MERPNKTPIFRDEHQPLITPKNLEIVKPELAHLRRFDRTTSLKELRIRLTGVDRSVFDLLTAER